MYHILIIMDTTSNEPRKCYVCSSILIPGDNINENYYKNGRKTCKLCRKKNDQEKIKKINNLCAIDESARRLRVRTLLRDCTTRTRRKEKKLISDNIEVLHNHFLEKYPVLPTKCPILNIDLIYSSVNYKDVNPSNRLNRISIDRIDSSKGYIVGNIQIISNRANTIKSDSSFSDVLKLFVFIKENDATDTNKIIKNNGFVFFRKSNRKKNNKKTKNLEKQGGVPPVVADDIEQLKFVF